MYDFYLHLKNRAPGVAITDDEKDIASGKTLLSSEKAKEIVKAVSLRSETLEKAFVKQQEKAAVSLPIQFISGTIIKWDLGAMEPG